MKGIAFFCVCWLLCFASIAAYLSPMMLRCGIPSLTLLAFVAPCLWVLASVALYIAWADSGWREEWERPIPAETTGQASLCNHQPTPRIC